MINVLFLDCYFICCAFYMLYGEHVIALLLGVAGHVVERFALSEQYFECVAWL